mmetsp:Transcript_13061/g.22955  ORF Transcript_13061/g.22955 Transcript_13061/m.22955 type:complete len:85 (-) Transcript_13061:220-474(-)
MKPHAAWMVQNVANLTGKKEALMSKYASPGFLKNFCSLLSSPTFKTRLKRNEANRLPHKMTPTFTRSSFGCITPPDFKFSNPFL